MEEHSLIGSLETFLRITAAAAPAAGLALGAAVGAAKSKKLIIKDALTGLGFGLLGTLIYGLWKLYIAIGESLGYSRISGVSLSAVIFLAVGFGVGIAVVLVCRRRHQ